MLLLVVMQRRRFLALATAAVAGSPILRPAVGRAAGQPTLRIGLIADAQYADVEASGTRHYRRSLDKLAEAVSRFDQLGLAFCLNLGDLIDRGWEHFDAILAALAASSHRFHHVLGNHDFEVPGECKARVPARLGLTQRQYVLEQAGWSVVVLDTNDVSVYAHPESTAAHGEAVAAFQRLANTGARNAQTWNGALSDRQLQWMEAACQSAARAGRRVIVVAHHPVYPDDAHNVWNSARVLEVLDRNRNAVAWLNGHNHAGAFGMRNGVPFITLKGMVETRDTNAYAVLNLHADRLELVGYGREPSREVKFRER